VSRLTKLILLWVVIGAILYVLISPLPELAATSTLKLPVLSVIFIVLLLSASLSNCCLVSQLGIAWVSERDILWSRNPVFLC